MDAEEIQDLQDLRAKYVRNLRQLRNQEADYGLNPPLELINGITKFKELIKDIDDQLQAGVANAQPTPDKHPQVATPLLDNIKLVNILATSFNTGELQGLCFALNIDYEDLPGQTKGDKARELVLYAERHGRKEELSSQVRQLRPHLTK